MDKRTLIFLIAVSLSLFLVNTFFHHQNEDNLKAWTEQQKAKKTQIIQKLESDLQTQTAKTADLPLVYVYADDQGKTLLTTGALIDKTLLAVSWNGEPPKEVYVKKINTTDKPKKLTLTYAPKNGGGDPIIYQEGPKASLRIGNLPDFGHYDLQVVFVNLKGTEPPFEITLGDYQDGQFTISRDKLDKLKKEIDPEGKAPVRAAANAIVLMKSGTEYLPIGIYQQSTKNILYLEDIVDLDKLTTKPEFKGQVSTDQKADQKYYVLENQYQQLVFTNIGGALVEINLPFQTKTDEQSAVREIEYDRDMVEKHPYNAKFPAHPYFTPGKNAQGPFNENREGKLGGYYPLIRRDLMESGNQKSIRINPKYYALNILSEYPEVAELVYEVKHFDENSITFEAVQSLRKITKTFTLPKEKAAPYTLDVTIKIDGDSRGLWVSSGVPEVEWISGSPAPALKYRITRNQKSEVEQIDLPKESLTNTSIFPDWVVNSNGFFGLILDPLTEINAGYKAQYVSGVTVPSRLVELDKTYDKFKAQSLPGYLLMMPLKTSGGTMNFRVFAGPFADSVLKSVDQVYSDASTGYNPDYISAQSFHGWFAFISAPFAKFLFILMNFFHTWTGSWAFSIILLTVALRIMLYPLNAWSTKSMVKMQQIAPEVAAIQERNKKDPKKGQLEIMNLYREKGVNPVSGCFPLLIQMPFLIGMFDLLKSTFELRGASFIPGWIDNLTSPDVLFSWETPIFFIGNQFHLLPILLGLVMFAQQRLFATGPTDPNLMTDQQRQQKAMGTIMAGVFTIMFYNFPSGLNIYWLSSMLLGMLQQWWTQKQMAKQAEKAVAQVKVQKGKETKKIK